MELLLHKEAELNKCTRCDNGWYSDVEEVPVHCPRCHSGLWGDTSGETYDWEPHPDYFTAIKGLQIWS